MSRNHRKNTQMN